MYRKLRYHWPEYFMEAAGLATFMISACVFTVLLMYPASPVAHWIVDPIWKRAVIGIAMGSTAIALIYSPWGKRSGAHFNPSVTIAFFRLGKIAPGDAFLYIVSQFTGAITGVLLCAVFFRSWISDSRVNYVVTAPGPKGASVALVSEFVISFLLMMMVLVFSNNKRLAAFTGIFAGILVATYITVEAPLSGMSMNPARTFGSALPAHMWKDWWIYFSAPPLGMLAAAEAYVKLAGAHKVICAKLHHGADRRCIFKCGYRRADAEPNSPSMLDPVGKRGDSSDVRDGASRRRKGKINLLKQLIVTAIFAVPSLGASGSALISEEKSLTLEGPRKDSEDRHLGTIVGPEHPHNMAWGDETGKTVYLCAKTGLYRIRSNIPGIRP